MALSAPRTLKNILPVAVKSYRYASSPLLTRTNVVMMSDISRQFTRSMWCLSKKRVSVKPLNSVSMRCGCCGLHTEGDRELAEFLTDEIKLEKESKSGSLPSLKGFTLAKEDGCDIAFSKQDGQETVKITFNVNNATDEEELSETSEENPDEPAELRCKPPFVVEINKGGEKTLHIQCQFPQHPAEDEQAAIEDGLDLVEITDVALLKAGVKWDEKAYTVQGGLMDGNLYDMLLNMINERGIDANLVDQLVHFSTIYEHNQYLNFLENLKDFAGSK